MISTYHWNALHTTDGPNTWLDFGTSTWRT